MYIITDLARKQPRRIFSPLSPKVEIGLGGEINRRATQKKPAYKVREANDAEYKILCKIPQYGHLVYLDTNFKEKKGKKED